MKKIYMTLAAVACVFCVSAGAEEAAKEIAAQAQADCSGMSADFQRFANQLNATNKRIFCGQFSDDQRATAMRYATQQDANGNMMSADQAVQKVASESNMRSSQKSPTGCPIK
jgi:hypothetical protein